MWGQQRQYCIVVQAGSPVAAKPVRSAHGRDHRPLALLCFGQWRARVRYDDDESLCITQRHGKYYYDGERKALDGRAWVVVHTFRAQSSPAAMHFYRAGQV